MKIERKKNAVRGTFWGIIQRMIQIIFPFLIRTIFIRTLGVEYLGLNSLFSAILQVLNLAELGVSSALVFSMYRPIAENDTEKICQLMNLYKRYYRIIGLVVMTIGLVLMPFLPKLINGNLPQDVNLYILYSMHLASTVLSYWLFAYRNSLFQAHQRVDITMIVQIMVNVCIYCLQATTLILFRNYYVYLFLTIIGQIVINIITALVSIKYYPNYAPKGDLSLVEKKSINQKMRDLFTAKIGAVINNAADSIVISAFIGLELLAVYQNYYYIISAIMAMFKIFFSACTAGIGNSLVLNSEEQNRTLLYNINHIVFMAINFSCVCFVSMCQPFIQLWVGDQYKLNFSFVILFAVYLFAEEAPRTLLVFKDAGGIWRHDRFRPLISACVNLALNLLLTPIIGLYGIIISTIFALLFVGYPWLIININNRLIKIGIKKYITRIFLYTIAIVTGSTISVAISSLINLNSRVLEIVIRFLVATIVSTVIFTGIFWRTEENKYVLLQIATVKNKLLHR